jgi:hypothetical protein
MKGEKLNVTADFYSFASFCSKCLASCRHILNSTPAAPSASPWRIESGGLVSTAARLGLRRSRCAIAMDFTARPPARSRKGTWRRALVGAELAGRQASFLSWLPAERIPNLCRLVSEARLRGQDGIRGALEGTPAYAEGLLVLTGDEEAFSKIPASRMSLKN